MPISESQANIFKRLYTQTVNQNHVKEWTWKNLEHKQASPIIARIIKLNYDMSKKQPDTFVEIQNWGREEVKKLGYVEPQFNKAI